MDPTQARFPHVPAGAGHYESFYLKAGHPSDPLAIWIRYTVHKHPNAAPKGSLWFTLFDGSADGPRASKVTLPEAHVGEGDWIAIGDSRFAEGEVTGSACSERLDADWRLRFQGAEPPLLHLPSERLYDTGLPRTKTCSPLPAARFDGSVTVAGHELAVRDWPGVVGHNWGAEHAERWIWLHGLGFERETDASWLDLIVGRVRIGPVTTPWLASGALSLDGRRHRLGGLRRRAKVRAVAAGCDFTLSGDGVRVRGRVRTELKDVVGWLYADPGGAEHQATNCSIADMSLTVERSDGPRRELRLAGGGSYELGRRERDPSVPVQPFPDG